MVLCRLVCVAEITSKVNQSQTLQRDCELMLLVQQIENLDERLATQVEHSAHGAAKHSLC